MPSDPSVTTWIGFLKGGDRAAVLPLYNRFIGRLVARARNVLHQDHRFADGAEDVALAAFASFCRGAEEGKFPDLNDRDYLEKLLFTIVRRKAAKVLQAEVGAQDGVRIISETNLQGTDSQAEAKLAQAEYTKPSPDVEAMMADEVQHLLGKLDNELRSIAVLLMEGYTREEVAKKLEVADRTIYRKLEKIRDLWQTG